MAITALLHYCITPFYRLWASACASYHNMILSHLFERGSRSMCACVSDWDSGRVRDQTVFLLPYGRLSELSIYGRNVFKTQFHFHFHTWWKHHTCHMIGDWWRWKWRGTVIDDSSDLCFGGVGTRVGELVIGRYRRWDGCGWFLRFEIWLIDGLIEARLGVRTGCANGLHHFDRVVVSNG